jgi:competence ComEA-like helix-hairpin-helix protein
VALRFFLVHRRRDRGHDEEAALHPININGADSEQLQQVPGIGPATADKILQMRKSYGAFKSVDDLLAIRGIGKKRLDKMRKYLALGKAPAGTPKKAGDGEFRAPREMFRLRRIGGSSLIEPLDRASQETRRKLRRRNARGRAGTSTIKRVKTGRRGLAAFQRLGDRGGAHG